MKKVVVLAMVLLPALASAELYKWTDAQGRVHFTDKKPEAAVKVEALQTPRAQGPGGAGSEATPAQGGGSQLERQRRMADILTQERERREEEASQKNKETAARKKKCHELQDYRQSAERSRLYDINEKGERTYMDDKAHTAHLRELDDNIARNCR
jgi:hypothetical protein